MDDPPNRPLLQKYDSNGVKGFVAMDEFIEVGTESTVDLRFRVLGTTCRRCTVDDGVVDPEVFDQRVDRRGANFVFNYEASVG